MKVALCFPGCHRRGGVERVVFECANFLGRHGHDVHVFGQEFEPIENARVHFQRINSAMRPSFLRGKRYFAACSKTV